MISNKYYQRNMTYNTHLFLKFIMVFIAIIGCKQKNSDVNINDLKNACDYVDAIEKLIINSADKIQLTKEQGKLAEAKDEYSELKKKVNLIETAALAKFDPTSIKECPNYQRVQLLYEYIK
jgi:hypothetical protein